MGFAYSEGNADLSSTHVKDIAHYSPVKHLSHQVSRCICYQYFSYDWRKDTQYRYETTMTDSWTDF